MSDIEELPCPACRKLVPTTGGPAYRVRELSDGESIDTARATERARCPHCGERARSSRGTGHRVAAETLITAQEGYEH
jgi:endogenous inhibitor of DNA gyrase (YacG/DUF329 family)